MLTWLAAGALLVVLNFAVVDYYGFIDRVGRRADVELTTPLQTIYPVFAADTQTWVRHALAVAEADGRHEVHWTTLDNAPVGRPVYWNSAWLRLLAWSGRTWQTWTGAALPRAMEQAAWWLNLPVVWLLLVGFSWWVSRRGGIAAGCLVAMALLGHDKFFEGFWPGYVDHHGLLTAAVFGLVLGVVFMGAGWRTADASASVMGFAVTARSARVAAMVSALAGAFGFWISAASVIPAVALTGACVVALLLLRGRRWRDGGLQFDPALWRWWGRTGAAASLLFYVLEFAPSHGGGRLEVNHPLWALAWWGGGELVALIGEWRLGLRAVPRMRWLWSVGLIGLPVVVIALAGESVFALRQAVVVGMHASIAEFQTLPQRVALEGWRGLRDLVDVNYLVLPVGALLLLTPAQRQNPAWWFAVLIAWALAAMGFWQVRWMLNASGPQIVLTLLIVLGVTQGVASRWRGLVVLAVAMLLYVVPFGRAIAHYRDGLRAEKVFPEDVMAGLYRDIAQALRQTQPEGGITLLSGATSSSEIGYYGRFQTLGTLYWENWEGYQAAAEILSAPSFHHAAVGVRAHGVTHIALVGHESFLRKFFELVRPDAHASEFEQSFGYRLLQGEEVPSWLEAILYAVPVSLPGGRPSVKLYRVRWEQSALEARYRLAEAAMVAGELANAERILVELTRLAPTAFEPPWRLAELRLAGGSVESAIADFARSIALAPRAAQAQLNHDAGNACRQAQAQAAAIRFYRASLADGFNAPSASHLAWLLATSPAENLRNGAEALTLARRVVVAHADTIAGLRALAAACAETGDFAEGVRVLEHALAVAKAKRRVADVDQLGRDLALLRRGQPLRGE
ncbi:MAG: hypothetical protein Q8M02_06685 [Candidatus Didemnitutus sp.]|nr:hypothetical protein [Candidatus Didemnitutus sp.]